ncbi:MAG TPA: DinB family protein [Thermoanaerobaculia bacterium]|nr:DinB family protein [Thermoanaerobaculia bacterium]
MNLVDLLAETPNRVRDLIEGRSEEQLSFKPSPDAFSLRENLLHLRDIDVEGYEVRVMRIVSESDPFFPDLDGARLARERTYNAQPAAPALESFAASRARSIARLRSMAPTALACTGNLEGNGRVTLQELLERWAQHDEEHLAEMGLLRGSA